jgi:hypothetical protein
MKEKFIYYKNKRTNSLERQYLTKQLEQEEQERKKRLLKVQYIQTKLAKQEYEDQQARGYCPECFCLRAWNGTCSCN